MKRMLYMLLAGGALMLSLPAVAETVAVAATAAPNPVTNFNKVAEVLVIVLVLSVVFEVALTPVFNWRYFLRYAEGSGLKTPIVVGTALLMFWSYDLDIVRDLLVALGYPAEQSVGGQLLTALLIAGGSDGVFRIFVKLNIRNPVERQIKTEQVRVQAGLPASQPSSGLSQMQAQPSQLPQYQGSPVSQPQPQPSQVQPQSQQQAQPLSTVTTAGAGAVTAASVVSPAQVSPAQVSPAQSG